MLPLRLGVVSLASATALLAQSKPAATWMNLPPGTDVSYSVEDDNKTTDGMGTGSGGSGRHAVRIVSLGADAAGMLRIALFDEQLPKESFETAIVRAEIVTLDPATGVVTATTENAAPMTSPRATFPFPALSAAEWKAKKPVSRTMVAPVAGEANELPFVVKWSTRKDGKKPVPVVTAELDAKAPVAVRLVGIAGMVAMAEGRMPKLGASGVEPVDAAVTALQREYTIDAKGNCSEVRTTGTVTAADGKLKIACSNVQKETARRVVAAKELPLVVEVVEGLCAIVADKGDKAAKRASVEALMANAKQAGFGAIAERLLDSLTRSGLPPGLGR